jgi:hypothetical protein
VQLAAIALGVQQAPNDAAVKKAISFMNLIRYPSRAAASGPCIAAKNAKPAADKATSVNYWQ